MSTIKVNEYNFRVLQGDPVKITTIYNFTILLNKTTTGTNIWSTIVCTNQENFYHSGVIWNITAWKRAYFCMEAFLKKSVNSKDLKINTLFRGFLNKEFLNWRIFCNISSKQQVIYFTCTNVQLKIILNLSFFFTQ